MELCPINALLSVKCQGRLREVKNKPKLQTFHSKGGRGRLPVDRFTRGSKCSDLTWKLLVFLKQLVAARGGRL